MDQGQAEADRDGSEALGRPFVGGSEDDEEEKEGHYDFSDEGRDHRVSAGGMLAKAVRGEAAFGREAFLAARDEVEHRGPGDPAENLGDEVGNHLRLRVTPRDDEPDSDRRIEVASRDVADRVGHRQDGETEGQGYADKTNPELYGIVTGREEHRREDRAAAAAEDEPEGAEELGHEFVFHY